MKKAEKLTILDELIGRTDKLECAKNSPHAPVVDDTLSFIRNALEKKNATVWDERIRNLRWYLIGFRTDGLTHENIQQWTTTKTRFINILVSIKNEVELYNPDEEEQNNISIHKNDDDSIIFFSHSSLDKPYGDVLEKFITGLGVKNDQLIYTSHPLHKIPLDANIYDYLRKNINRNIFMIILWSDKYLESPACLNEMGAAWVTQSDYTNIFTPTFHFGNPKFHECAVDTRKMGAILNGDSHCKTSMLELKDKILSMFGLEIDEKTSTYLLDEFIKEITEINK